MQECKQQESRQDTPTALRVDLKSKQTGRLAGNERPEMLVCAALHLMTQYAIRLHSDDTNERLAAVIERHLKALAEFPGLEPVLGATCQQLAEQWATLVDQRKPVAATPNFLARLVAPLR